MSNPWSDFERNVPERGFTPASTGAHDPEADSWSPQELFDSLISPPERTPIAEPAPSFDTFVMAETPQPEQVIPEWGVPSAEDETGIPGVTFSNHSDAPRPKGRIALVSALAAGAVAICAVATIVGVNLLSGAGSSPEETTTEETTEPSAPSPPPEAPISTLSLDVKKDLAFAADIPSKGTSLKNVSVALDADPDWTREDSAGVTTYRNVNGCVVNWSQKDQSFPAGVTDFGASHEALFEVTQDRNFMVTEYGYWTPNSTDRAGKTEVVESRVDQDGKAVVVAARASVATGEVGLIWMSCEDPSKLSRFASDVRFDVGFILDGLKP